MEEKDLQLIRKYVPHNQELKRLWDEHLDLEKRLEQFNRRNYLSTEDELLKKQIQKLKLAGKDRIEEILKTYRSA